MFSHGSQSHPFVSATLRGFVEAGFVFMEGGRGMGAMFLWHEYSGLVSWTGDIHALFRGNMAVTGKDGAIRGVCQDEDVNMA